MNNLAIKETGPALFQKWGKLFQEKIFQAMAIDKDWAGQMYEVMKPHYFELKYLHYLCEQYFEYYNKYSCFPTMQLLIQIVANDLGSDGTEGILRNQIVQYIQRIRTNPNAEDLHHVKDQALDFCKRQAFKEALVKSVELVEEEDFESVIDIMKEAVAVGMPNTIGHDFFDDIEARFQEIVRIVTPTGMRELDSREILDGGLGRGELGVVVAPTGVGKSHWLVSMGAEALKVGKTVVHYTMELSETLTGKRYDSYLTNIPVSDLYQNKENVINFYKNNHLGKLIIKHYPMRSATVNNLRSHIEKLKLKGIYPSLVIIDYADLMRSSKEYDALRHELRLIYEELRGLADEQNVSMWTASQSNKEGEKSEVVGLGNMGEAYGKAQTADFVLGLSRKPEEKAKGVGRLFIAKNRAGTDGLMYNIAIDTSRSQFRILEEAEIMEIDPKQKLREVWKEVKQVKKDMELNND